MQELGLEVTLLEAQHAECSLARRRNSPKFKSLACIDTMLARRASNDDDADAKSVTCSTAGTAAPADDFAGDAKDSTDHSPMPMMSSLQQRRMRRMGRNVTLQFTIDCSCAGEVKEAWSPKIHEVYEIFEALGHGSVGTVYRGRRRQDRQLVALKQQRVSDEEMLAIARYEFEILRSVEHPHIIRAFDFFVNSQGVTLVLEYFGGRPLDAAVQAVGRLSAAVAKRPFTALASATAYLHGRGIIHRDIKAPNVLVTYDFEDLRLVDFNTARRQSEGALSMTGTYDWLPPEVMQGTSPSESSDIWGMGLCLLLMLTGSLPVQRRWYRSHQEFGSALVTLYAEKFQELAIADVGEACIAVLRGCLEVEHGKRFNSATVLGCDWLQN